MNPTIGRLAFAIQDSKTNRLEAQRIARTVLSLLQLGDEIGRGLVVQQIASLHGNEQNEPSTGSLVQDV